MKPIFILLLITLYFGVLFLISYATGKDDSNQAFFKADNKSPWYLVAFGMVGASLSGVTFISVPGWVQETQFSYMQVVLGYIFGYVVIAFVLLPIYYKLNVTSIYEYLDQRFGVVSYKTGALFFFIARVIGSAFGLYLVANVLQHFVFDAWHIPFYVTVTLSVLLIWLYTLRGGIKTVVWTDTFQTLFMLTAALLTVYFIASELNWSIKNMMTAEELKPYTQIIFTDDILAKNYFWKSFLSGIFITICMTGLDQNMMQKNLTCKNLKDAKKNVLSYSLAFVPVNIIFLMLGALLYVYAQKTGLDTSGRADLLFPKIALNGDLGVGLGVVFVLGLIAAAYSSADSALTALTTSFCVDFLNIEKRKAEQKVALRKKVHAGLSALLVVVIIIFNYFLDSSVIDLLFTAVSYTYGPLLGLFTFGIFTKKKVHDKWVLWVALLAAATTFGLGQIPSEYLGGYHFHYELLIVNGALTFLGLILISRK